jgi:L-cysteine S-thiosulfotransferase
MKTLFTILPVLAVIASCTTPPALLATAPAIDYDKALASMMQAGFETRGIASIDRLKQDTTNIECSKDTKPDAKLSEAIEKANLATIKPPSDGVYLGDFKAGEVVAQSGRGNTWTDSATAPNGGNCYNCHQISKTEVSYGSLGPSLYNYGKLRGNSQAIVDYTWGKLQNAKAYNACSGMPRFGHAGILTEKQIKDVMALLLDPASPVNQ